MGGAGTPAGFAGGISIDQRIAADIGMNTRFPSLEFGVMVQNSDVWARMIYSGANQPLPPMEDPVAAFSRIFAGSTLSASQQAILLKRRQSTLDYAQGSLSGLSGRIGSDDKVRVEQHLNSVQQIEKQLLAQTGACTPPMVTKTDLTNVANYPAIGKTQMDLLVASLACDQTRIASLQWSHSVSDIPMPWLSISTGHHTLSHDADTDTPSQTSLVQINTWYAQQFAYLLKRPRRGDRVGRLHAARQLHGGVDQRAGEGQHPQPQPAAGRDRRQRRRRAALGASGHLQPGAAAQQPPRVDRERDGDEHHDVRQPRLLHGTALQPDVSLA